MTVFKGYMLLAKRNIKGIIVYFTIFTGIAVAMGMSRNGKFSSFTATKLNIAVVDCDRSECSEEVVRFLKKNHHVTEASYDPSALQERLYYENVKLVVCIQKGFEKDTLSGKGGGIEYTQNPGEYNGMYVEAQLNRLVQNMKQYYDAGYSVSESYDKVARQPQSKVHMENINGNGGQEAGYVGFFRFYPYLMLAVLCTILGTLLVEFRNKNVKMRLNASSVSLFSQNITSIFVFLMIGCILYAVTMLLAFAIHGRKLVTAPNLWYYFLNSFLVMLISLAISFLVGLFVKNRQQVSIIVTPISLAFCFLCGVFVPIQYMPDGIVHIARFLPIYWFETVNDLLAKHADISGHIQSQILRGMGMELLFFIVLISCSMAVAKYQQQEG